MYLRHLTLWTVNLLAATLLSPLSAQTPLENLATISQATSHRASSYDREGGNDDNIVAFAPGAVHTLLETSGPGKITHIWMTVSAYDGHLHPLRDLAIRIYWEGSSTPSVDVPLGDFFGQGHGKNYPLVSAPIQVGLNEMALNCYWPMPFHKQAKVEIVNIGERSIRRIYYNLDYQLGENPPDQGLFHARYHRVRELMPLPLEGNTHGRGNYVILDTLGEGHYVGCFLFVDSAPGGWWGEGDEMIFMDGEEKPSIVGTGTEDYFGNAWGYKKSFSYPYYGAPWLERQPDRWLQTTLYRFHLPDPVHFQQQIRVTLEPTWPKKTANDYSSVAFWYQREVASGGAELPSFEENQPRDHRRPEDRLGALQRCGTQFEAGLRAAGIDVAAVTVDHRDAFGGAYLSINSGGERIDLTMPRVPAGKYRLHLCLAKDAGATSVRLGIAGEEGHRFEGPGEVELGVVEVGEAQEVRFWVESPDQVPLDYVRLAPESPDER